MKRKPINQPEPLWLEIVSFIGLAILAYPLAVLLFAL